MLPRSIVFPVDFSNRCRAAAPAVAQLSARLNAPVTLLHSIDFGLDKGDEAALSEEFDAIRRRFRRRLDHFAQAELPAAARELATGPPPASILHCAENLDAPLIMMATRGHTRFRQLLLGSVTAAVLHDAACPVWTEAHSASDAPPCGVARGAIVCAVDLGPQTLHVLQAACAFASLFGIPWFAAHSIPAIDSRFPSRPAARAHLLAVAQARDKFCELSSNHRFGAGLELVEEPDLVGGILTLVRKHDAGLLVIGRGCIQGALGRLRTTAHDLIRRSPCPVLSV